MKVYELNVKSYEYRPVTGGSPTEIPVAAFLAVLVVDQRLGLTRAGLLQRVSLVAKLEQAVLDDEETVVLSEQEFGLLKQVCDTLQAGWDRPLFELAERIETCQPQEVELKVAK